MQFKTCKSFIAFIVVGLPSFAAVQASDCEEITSLEASSVLLHAMTEINSSGLSVDGLNVQTICKRIKAMDTRAYREIATYNFEFLDGFGNDPGVKLLITKWASYRHTSYTVKVEKTEAQRPGHPMLPCPVQP